MLLESLAFSLLHSAEAPLVISCEEEEDEMKLFHRPSEDSSLLLTWILSLTALAAFLMVSIAVCRRASERDYFEYEYRMKRLVNRARLFIVNSRLRESQGRDRTGQRVYLSILSTQWYDGERRKSDDSDDSLVVRQWSRDETV